VSEFVRSKYRLSIGALALLLATTVPQTAGAVSQVGTFSDDDGNVHEGTIEAIAAAGITRGCNPPVNDHYCPDDPVTRGQMAALVSRALQLPQAAIDHFHDDDPSHFEPDINALAEAGITRGCNPPANDSYCPDDFVTRGQMAALLSRAFGYAPGSADHFVDDQGSIFAPDINAVAQAGVTRGCNPPANDRFCPNEWVRRDQMASFLTRALGLAVQAPGVESSPSNLPAAALLPLEVSVNGRHIQTSDGVPIFLLGDTIWSGPHHLYVLSSFSGLIPNDFKLYLNSRQAAGFNLIAFDVLPSSRNERTTPFELAYSPSPFEGDWFDSALNDDYWRIIDLWLDMLEERGMYAWMLPAWAKDVLGSSGDAAQNLNVNNARAYGRQVGERYADRTNIWWVMGGDRQPDLSVNGQSVKAVYDELAAGIAEGINGSPTDFSGILMSHHPSPTAGTGQTIHGKAWNKANTLQTGHYIVREPYSEIVNDWNLSPAKPIYQSEVMYEDRLDGSSTSCDDEVRYRATDVRRTMWQSVLAGSSVVIYGQNEVHIPHYLSDLNAVQESCSGAPDILEFESVWQEMLERPGALDMQHLRNLVWSRAHENGSSDFGPFFNRQPDQSVHQGDKSGADLVAGSRSGARYAIVYIPGDASDSITVALSWAEGPEVELWWYSPRDGLTYDGANRQVSSPFDVVSSSGTKTYGLPTSGDWVLVMDSSNTDFPVPGAAP
jgi:hypothetical protein